MTTKTIEIQEAAPPRTPPILSPQELRRLLRAPNRRRRGGRLGAFRTKFFVVGPQSSIFS